MATALSDLWINIRIFSFDFLLTVYGLITPSLPADQVVPKGCPGYKGDWPDYTKPEPGDSRCSCPAINAMANHGILPHDGKNITFKQLSEACRKTFNFASTFCEYVPRTAATYLNRSYATGKFDLHELDVRNSKSIEHDASLVRQDICVEPDQSIIAHHLVSQLLKEASATDTKQSPILTKQDLGRCLAKRRVQSSLGNEKFKLAKRHKLFGDANASTLLTIFGGRVADLEPFLHEERIPRGWQPAIRRRGGLTSAIFNTTVLPVRFIAKKQQPIEHRAAVADLAPPQ